MTTPPSGDAAIPTRYGRTAGAGVSFVLPSRSPFGAYLTTATHRSDEVAATTTSPAASMTMPAGDSESPKSSERTHSRAPPGAYFATTRSVFSPLRAAAAT